MKKIITVIIIALFTGCCVSCGNNSDDSVEILKRRIDKCEMVEYVDSFYGAIHMGSGTMSSVDIL